MFFYKLVQVGDLKKTQKPAFTDSKGAMRKGHNPQFLIARKGSTAVGFFGGIGDFKVFRSSAPRKSDFVFVRQIFTPSPFWCYGLCLIVGIILGVLLCPW